MVRAPMIWRVQSQYFSQTKVTRNLESQAPSAQCGLVSEDCADNNRAAGGATPMVRPKSELLLATGDAGWPDLRCGHSCSAVPTPYETIRQLAARHKNAPASGGFGRRCLTFKSLASPLANYSRSADKIKPSPGSWLAGTPPDEAAWWAEANLEPLPIAQQLWNQTRSTGAGHCASHRPAANCSNQTAAVAAGSLT